MMKQMFVHFSGVTNEGDGFQFGGSINSGFKLAEDGFINFTTSFLDQEETNRAGEPGKDDLFGVPASNPWIQQNPDLGMTIGLPNITSGSIVFNSELNLRNMDRIYSNGGLVYRQGTSYALYRTPYWIPDNNFLHHSPGSPYNGFQPTFETDIFDSYFTLGFKSQKSDWNYDLSYTFGMNTVDYTIGNSLNLALGELSPTEFRAGGYEFNHHVINFDFSKTLENMIFLGFGTEFRQENFIARAGEEASYTGAGAQSFPGLQPQNEVNAKRINVGAYLDLGIDINQNLYVGGAARYEKYSDFGVSKTYKLNARFKTDDDKYSVRGSISTGFRAPSLHQIYLSNIQTLVSGGTVSNQGTFNNNSPVLRKLGVSKLKEEESFNITFGVAAKPMENFTFSADLYQIDVDDRIVYSSSIASSDTNTTIGAILNDNNITSLKFFTNAVDTRTRGFDLVANYTMDMLKFNLAASISEHTIEGKVNTPSVISSAGIDLFDRKEQSRILTSRPTTKYIFGVTAEIEQLTINTSATYFGEVTWQHASTPANDQTFAAKAIFDLNLKYTLTEELSLRFIMNNVFDTYPDQIDTNGDPVTDLGGRFKYPMGS